MRQLRPQECPPRGHSTEANQSKETYIYKKEEIFNAKVFSGHIKMKKKNKFKKSLIFAGEFHTLTGVAVLNPQPLSLRYTSTSSENSPNTYKK